MEAKYSSLSDEIGVSLLSQMNVVETLLDRDCFCIALHFDFANCSIVDPSRVKIKHVHPEILNVSSALEGSAFQLK